MLFAQIPATTIVMFRTDETYAKEACFQWPILPKEID